MSGRQCLTGVLRTTLASGKSAGAVQIFSFIPLWSDKIQEVISVFLKF